MGLLQQQSLIEKGKPDLANAAFPTSQSYALIFQHLGSITQSTSSGLAEIGGELGKLIYWRDAFDDIEADRKAGKFNPLTYTPTAELESNARDAMEKLTNALSNLRVKRNYDLISQISPSTAHKHRDFLGYSYEEEDHKERKRRKWCENADCCSDPFYCIEDCDSCCTKSSRPSGGQCGRGSCCDNMCDCRPGDTGCCDCNPCDGCCCD